MANLQHREACRKIHDWYLQFHFPVILFERWVKLNPSPTVLHVFTVIERTHRVSIPHKRTQTSLDVLNISRWDKCSHPPFTHDNKIPWDTLGLIVDLVFPPVFLFKMWKLSLIITLPCRHIWLLLLPPNFSSSWIMEFWVELFVLHVFPVVE